MKVDTDIYILNFDNDTKSEKLVTKVAKEAPAPKVTNNAGIAQQIKVEEAAKSDKKLKDISNLNIIIKFPRQPISWPSVHFPKFFC